MGLNTNLLKFNNKTAGFTIVELLIVIVIIGILATITIISYVGISTKATEATLRSDLANASKKLKLYYVEHNLYPQDLDINGCPTIPLDNNYCIKPTPGNTFDYTATSPYSDYTLTVEKGDAKYKILGSDTVPVKVNTTPITAIADITGTVKEGQTLTAGAITPGGATVNYQWQIATASNGIYTNISGANNITYSPTSGDVGKYLKVQVTGTGDYRDATTSNPTTIIIAVTTPITGIAAITGTAQIGQTLTAGAVTPGGATVNYQWQSATTAGGAYTNIAGATGSTYVLASGDFNKYIKIIVTGTNLYSGSLISTPTGVITDPNWVMIGSQKWAKFNLNVGTMVSGSVGQTNNAITEKYCYDNLESNCTTYGGLYQWGEAMQYTTLEGSRGICPVGSHIPTDNELKTLEMQLGMTQAQADLSYVMRGTDQGTQLKSGGSSGFNVLLAGSRTTVGSFADILNGGIILASTESGNNNWYRYFNSSQGSIYRYAESKLNGYSVRCLGN